MHEIYDKILKFCACYVLFQRITFKSMVLPTRPLPSSSSFPSVVRYTSVEMFWKMVLEQQSFPEKKFRVQNVDSLKPWNLKHKFLPTWEGFNNSKSANVTPYSIISNP